MAILIWNTMMDCMANRKGFIPELNALLDADIFQLLSDHPGTFEVDVFRVVQKQKKWVHYEFKVRYIERGFCKWEQLFKRQRKKDFLRSVVTWNAK